MNKTMKNIKMVPTYACKLGNGIFAGTKWQCTRCGVTINCNLRPSDRSGGRCPSTDSGNHIWVQC